MSSCSQRADIDCQQVCLQRPLVVLFGDSLTQYSFDPDGGWGAALAHHLQRKADVINRGHSGYNSRWALPVFRNILQQVALQQVLLLTICLGANDAAIPGRSAEVQHVPLAEYSANLRDLVMAAQAAGVQHIVLLTPPPVHDDGRVQHQQEKMGINTPVAPDRSLEYVKQYAAGVVELGQELQVPVVDLFTKLQDVPDWQTHLLKDGLHFTPDGSREVWRQLHNVLSTQLPGLSLDSLPFHLPKWDQIDKGDVEGYFKALTAKLDSTS